MQTDKPFFMKIVTIEVNQFHKLNQLSGYVINYLCKQDEMKRKIIYLGFKRRGVQQTLKRYNSLKTKLLFSLNYGVHHILTNFIFWSSYPFTIACQVSTTPREEKSPERKQENAPRRCQNFVISWLLGISVSIYILMPFYSKKNLKTMLSTLCLPLYYW